MKRLNKSMILVGVALAIIGMTSILQTNLIKEELQNPKLQAYNHNPANILDNVFVENNTNILPFIFENANQTVSRDTIVSEFKKAGLTVKNISTGTTIATGTTITVNENAKVYTVLIYGDVNGDGRVNLIDAQRIVLYQKNPTTRPLTGMNFKAGNVSNKDNVINLIDAQRVVLFHKGQLDKLVVVEPTSAKELDSVKPVITLKGAATIEIPLGGTYTELGATATDNYDGNISNKIIIKNNINTSRVGTYTVTYDVTDSNGNKANTVTRTVIVNDVLLGIKMKSNPNKLVYNYGESLDLTGGTIYEVWKSGAQKEVAITQSMISNYQPTTVGDQTVQVSHSAFTTNFKVQVLNKIVGIELTENARENVEFTTGGFYKVTSQEDFVLGTLKETSQVNGSKLTAEQVNIEIEVISGNVLKEDLKLDAVEDEQGNVLIKGNAKKDGNYTISIWIQYGEEKISIAPIQLQVVKNQEISQILLESIADGEVKVDGNSVVEKELTILNKNGEEIEVASKNIAISIPEDIAQGITIEKLDENKRPIMDQNVPVKYLRIETTIEEEKEVSFTIIVTEDTQEEANKKEQKITFKIGEASVLSRIEIDAEELKLYMQEQSLENVVQQDGNIYTIVPIKFFDQYGQEMTLIQQEAIKVIINSPKDLVEGEVGIVLPEVDKTINNNPEPIKGSGLSVKFFTAEGNEANGYDSVAKIGFAVIQNVPGTQIDLDSFEGQEIIIACANQTEEFTLPITIVNSNN